MLVGTLQEAASESSVEIETNLAVLRATDEAHRRGLITRGQRYHILQSMFPPVEQRTSNLMDFTTSTEIPAPGLSAEEVSRTVIDRIRKQHHNTDQHLMLVNT